MSLLGNLITQVARSAMQPEQNNHVNQRGTSGGLGDILGSVLGSQMGNQMGRQPHQPQHRQANNDFGLDDVLGSVLGSAMGGGMGHQMGQTGGLGSILGSVLGSGMGGGLGGGNRQMSGKGMLIAALLPVVLGWIQRNGGLSGALAKVQQMGMQNNAQSWMDASQPNQNLDLDQVSQLFDANDIHQVAGQVGADENEVRQGLAELLPEVMNQLTPRGGLEDEQEANQEIDDIMSQLSAQLGQFGR